MDGLMDGLYIVLPGRNGSFTSALKGLFYTLNG